HHFQPAKCQQLGIHAGAARQVGELVEQFVRISGAEADEPSASGEALARCLLAGFSDHVAKRIDGGTLRCHMTHGRKAELSRESVVRDAEMVVAAEVTEINTRDRLAVVLSLVSPIKEEWIEELFPVETTTERRVVFDSTLKRVVVLNEKRFRSLVLVRGKMGEPTEEEAARALALEINEGRLSLPGWDQGVEDWIERLNWASTHLADWQFPRIEKAEREALVAQICHGCSCERDLAKAPVREVVFGWLSPTQKRQLDVVAPEKVEMPNGRRVKIDYRAAGGPTIRVLIQDLYGVEHDLRIAGGKVPLVIEVLAPNRRPVQVTQSLETFWKEAYPRLKIELKRRYPRHEWK
ncbi:MAG: ATP-dependent helicase C-terminal domain-containing protein, partial [Verrucomicrobiia bacterium]